MMSVRFGAVSKSWMVWASGRWKLSSASNARSARSVHGSCRPVMSLERFVASVTPEEEKKATAERFLSARRELVRDFRKFPAFGTRVAGVSFENRQSVLETVRASDPVIFEREPHNAYDSEAVKVLLVDGRRLGYVPRDSTSYFGSVSVAGRVRSVGLGQSGYYGAEVMVQPQLPSLLPAFLPPSLALFSNPFEGYNEEQMQKLVQYLKEQGNERCALTGLEGSLQPCLFWRVHMDLKQFELSGIRLIHPDLIPVALMQEDNRYLMCLLSAVNEYTSLSALEFFTGFSHFRWTEGEADLYVYSCMVRRGNMDKEWVVRSVGLRELLARLELPLPPALKLKSE